MKENTKDFLKAVACRIEDLLLAMEMSYSDLANEMQVNPGVITKMLKGTNNFTLETLLKIENILGNSIVQVSSEKIKANPRKLKAKIDEMENELAILKETLKKYNPQ